MNTIPVSQLVQVNPGVLAAAGTQNDLIALILTNDQSVPVDSVMPFADALDVGNYFGLSSQEYEAAGIYFNGPNNATKAAKQLLFAQYPDAPVGAWLRGAALDLTLSQLQALTGTLTITINGTANTSASINLSAATSFTNAATIIQAAFTSPNFTVTYDAQRKAFLFTSSVTGDTSTATYATGALAAPLLLTAATGATTSQGANAADPAGEMNSLINVSQAWATFLTIFEPVTADKIAFSQWTNSQDKRYAYIGWDSDPNAKVLNNTTTWGYAVKQAAYDGSVLIYGDLTHAAFVAGYAASLDFTRFNGRTTAAFRTQDGLIPSVDNATDAQNLLANGYNFYGVYATGSQQFNMLQNGSVSGQYLWLDSYLNQVWMRTNFQLSLLALLMNTGSIPYNDDGDASIDAALADPIQAALNYGAIRSGIALSAAQQQEVNQAVGKVVAPIIMATGYYVDIQPSSPATRVARSSPPLTVYYTDGESVQGIVLSAIEIQ